MNKWSKVMDPSGCRQSGAKRCRDVDWTQTMNQDWFSQASNTGIRRLAALITASTEMDLSRFCAAPCTRLSYLSFESDRAFPAQC